MADYVNRHTGSHYTGPQCCSKFVRLVEAYRVSKIILIRDIYVYVLLIIFNFSPRLDILEGIPEESGVGMVFIGLMLFPLSSGKGRVCIRNLSNWNLFILNTIYL